ncbi:MAG: ribosome-associated translation inhibitor RaiA [Nannocystis sp.]|jgi:ribosomal subunit interface protein|nr:ribosome-associated translation inhibitor RaiA [Nannocystis sp.]
MQVPLQIAFQDIEPSEFIETRIREKVTKLERYYDRIISVRVVVAAPHRSSNHGNTYNVRIDINIPDKELVINRQPEANGAYEDVYVVIRDAFEAAERQLKDEARIRRGA